MESELIIKIAEARDSRIIARILSAAFQEFKDKYTPKAFDATVISPEEVKMRIKNGIVWIASLDKEPIGTVSGKIMANTFYIKGMAVLPKERGKKIAYLLLKAIEEYAVENNCDELLLNTTPYLNKAIRLYDKFGFKIINKPPYELFETPLFNMKKSLK